MDIPYEQPTDELRQVLRRSDPGSGIRLGDRYLVVQRKWLIFDGVAHDAELVVGSLDGTMVNNVVGRPVWRDLPTVTDPNAP